MAIIQLKPTYPSNGKLAFFTIIKENYDPDVRTDMEAILNHMVKEREPYYEHTMEG